MNLFRTPWLHQPLLSRSRYGRTGYSDRTLRNRGPRPTSGSDHETTRVPVGGFRLTRT